MVKKPERTGAVEKAIDEMSKTKENILNTSENNIYLLKIKDINELTLEDGTLMHNRLNCTKSKLNDLAENIAILRNENAGLFGTGVLQAILVRKKNNIYERVFGFSRISALQMNKQEDVPAIVVENLSDELARFIRSSENLNREDLNAYDETYSIMEHIMLVCKFGTIERVKSFLNKIKNFKTGKIQSLTENEMDLLEEVDAVFRRIGRYEAITFADRMNILDINPFIKEAIIEGYINYSQAIVIKSKAKTEKDIIQVLKVLKNKNLSVTELKAFFVALYSNDNISQTAVKGTIMELYENLKELSKIPKKSFKNITEQDKKELEKHIVKINEILKKGEIN